MQKRKIFLILALLGFVTVITIYGIDSNYYVSSQINWFLEINHKLSVLLYFWLNLTQLGNAFVLFPLLSFLIFWHPQAWASMFAAAPLAAILSVLGKKFFSMPRPAAIIDNNQFAIIGQTLGGNNSLPSGHTITIFTALTSILCVLILTKKIRCHNLWRILMTGLASLVALSRIAVGAHWPFDLVLGAILGTFAGFSGVFLTFKYNSWWIWMTIPKYRYIHSLILLIFPMVLLFENKYLNLIVIWLSIIAASLSSIYLFATRGK